MQSTAIANLDVADLQVVVRRLDLCDHRQGLEVTGEAQAATGPQNLEKGG